MRQDRRRRFYALSAGLVAFAALAALGPVPWFVALMVALTVEAFLICWVLPTGLAQNLFLSLGVVLVVLTGFDLKTRWWELDDKLNKIYPKEYSRSLFNQPRAAPTSFSAVGIRKKTGERIYSVTYTLDTNGHRLTRGGGPTSDTYLFFGDSFTYGEGVEDFETLPALFSAALDYRFTVPNLAFSGFGPHQMLRLLETGSVDRVVTGKVRRAFFPIIGDHVQRVVGEYLYTLTGPEYRLDANGRPRFRGRFVDNLDGRLNWLAENAGGAPARLSDIARQVLMPTSYRLDLLTAILAESARILRERYQTELVIVVWSQPDGIDLDGPIRKRGIRTVDVESLIGDIRAPGMRLRAGVDGHPTATANRLLSTALAAMESATTSALPAAAE
jgi:hypothetical protein